MELHNGTFEKTERIWELIEFLRQFRLLLLLGVLETLIFIAAVRKKLAKEEFIIKLDASPAVSNPLNGEFLSELILASQ